MTNETKELLDAFKAMFNAMEQRNREMIDALDTKIDRVQQEVGNIKPTIDGLDTKINSVQQETGNIKTLIENTTNKNIQILAEGYTSLSEKVDAIKAETDKIPDLCEKVELIEAVVTDHSKRLNKLA